MMDKRKGEKEDKEEVEKQGSSEKRSGWKGGIGNMESGGVRGGVA